MNRLRIARGIFLGVVAVVGFFIVYSILKRPEPSSPPLVITLQPRVTQAPTALAAIEVYVTGAINKPDVYTLPPGSIVKDLISAAGGATADADLEQINLAQRLVDQMHVHVPRKGEVAPTPHVESEVATAVNINTADATQLDTLPGIGPSLAQAIIDYRTSNGPFKKIEDINNVKGIGDALFDKIKDMITVGP